MDPKGMNTNEMKAFCKSVLESGKPLLWQQKQLRAMGMSVADAKAYQNVQSPDKR